MQVVPLFGSGVYGKSAVVTRQRRVNCYYETRTDGDKSKVVVYGTPGLVLLFALATPTSLPLRALLCANETALYAVQGNQFLSLNSAGGVLFTAAINTIGGLCSLAPSPNGSQIMLVDGVGGWVYQPGPGTFLAVTSASSGWFVPGAMTVTNVGGYFVAELPGTNQFGVSNLNDATTGSALSFGAIAAFPDICIAVDNVAGNLVPFGNTHLEFWQPVGLPPPTNPFAPIQSATVQVGLAAIFSRAHVGDRLLFLGKTPQGTKRVYQIDGYAVTPVSEEIDWIINQVGFVVTDATALTYQRDKHPFYQLTFPTMNRTFLFDLSTGIWNETQSGLTTGGPIRHQGNISSYYGSINNGDTLVTDWQNGNVYRMDDATFADNGVPVLREIVTRHQVKGYNRFRVPQIYLDMETGVGLPAVTSGNVPQGVDPQISIEVSKDNGRSWLAPRLIPLGRQGQYLVKVKARRFGQSRVFTFRIRMTDPVKFVITDGALLTKSGKAGR
jgi:hypothetical protein